jgi:hypothetical protein
MPVGPEGLRTLLGMAGVAGFGLGNPVEGFIFKGMHFMAGSTGKVSKLVLAAMPIEGISRCMTIGADLVLVLYTRYIGRIFSKYHIRRCAPAV